LTQNLTIYLLLLLLLAGCNSAVQNSWTNFTAYYNTFYNAQQNFEKGMRSVEQQKQDINPEQPIRVYPEPIRAGRNDFELAIEKGADILRNHPDSKWVDDALFLIGRSYFYLQKYFAAEQKFEELYNSTEKNEFKRKAVFWRGRTFLELDQTEAGLSYLLDAVNDESLSWGTDQKAKVYAVIAQMYTGEENWDQSAEYLSRALEDMSESDFRPRAYFLYGQILEKIDKPEEALAAYKQVQNDHPFYNLVYQSQRKQAEMARTIGNYSQAYEVFKAMSRDDKNFDIQSELRYEMAKTLQEMKEYREAEQLYNDVIHNSINKPTQVTVAKSYYGLAEIYRNYYDNLNKAAAYFDSAATQRASKEKLPEDFKPDQMASIYGNYSDLTQQAHMVDSLLWLAGLSETKFDSVITELKKQKLEKIKKQKERRRQQANTAFVNNTNDRRQGQQRQRQQTTNFFLNYRDAQMVREDREEFNAIWNNRPLVDNWRRIDDVRKAVEEGDTTESTPQSGDDITAANTEEDNELRTVQIDLQEVPFSEEKKQEKKNELASIYYELGNVFFLSLNNPDSAEYYYKTIINNYPESDLVVKAMYSLSELYFVNDQNKLAESWAEKLIDKYPQTNFAYRLKQRFGIETDYEFEQETEIDSVNQTYTQLQNRAGGKNPEEKAQLYQQFASTYSKNKLASDALEKAIENYLIVAKNTESYQKNVDQWFKANNNWEQKKRAFQQKKDSANTVLQDTTQQISEEKQTRLVELQDSTLQKPDFSEHFPYQGAKWDSTRKLVNQYTKLYSNNTRADYMKVLKDELEIPSALKEEQQEDEANGEKNEQNVIKEENDENKVYRCSELGKTPEVVGGMYNFANSIKYPDALRSLSLAGELPYEVTINVEGLVEEAEFAGQKSGTNIEEVIKEALLNKIRFKPITREEQPVKAKCNINVPVSI